MPVLPNQLILPSLALKLTSHDFMRKERWAGAPDAHIGFIVDMVGETIADIPAFTEIYPSPLVEQRIHP